MVIDSTSQWALLIIAVAVSVQAILFVAVVIAATIAWKRTFVSLDARLAAVAARLDSVTDETRRAAESVEALSGQARDVFHTAGSVVRNVTSAVPTPRAYLVATAASALSGALSRWRQRKAVPVSNVTRIQSIH